MDSFGFHTKHGLYFQRVGPGDVVVRKVTSGGVMFKATLDPDTWASVMASMSARGEDEATFQEARTFHLKSKGE